MLVRPHREFFEVNWVMFSPFSRGLAIGIIKYFCDIKVPMWNPGIIFSVHLILADVVRHLRKRLR